MREQRFNSIPEVRAVRSSSSDSPGTIVGYASVFNSLSSDLGGFKERVAPGAFRASLASNPDVKALVNHDPNRIVGRTTNGTLRLMEDEHGLKMACMLPDTSTGRDLYASITRGDVSEMSFAFSVSPDGDTWDDEDDPETDSRISVRTLRSVKLLDVSCVVYPAYGSTKVGVDRLDPALVMGRSLFPQGVPQEIRSRFPNVQQVRATTTSQDRRRFNNLIIGM
jgi:HK97 family phage prohead protease